MVELPLQQQVAEKEEVKAGENYHCEMQRGNGSGKERCRLPL